MPRPSTDVNDWDHFKKFEEQVGRPIASGLSSISNWGNSHMDDTSQAWIDFKKKYPMTALAMSMVPVSGQGTAAMDLYDANKRGDVVDAGLAAAQFLPFGGVIKGARSATQLTGNASKAAAIKATAAAAVQGSNILDYFKSIP